MQTTTSQLLRPIDPRGKNGGGGLLSTATHLSSWPACGAGEVWTEAAPTAEGGEAAGCGEGGRCDAAACEDAGGACHPPQPPPAPAASPAGPAAATPGEAGREAGREPEACGRPFGSRHCGTGGMSKGGRPVSSTYATTPSAYGEGSEKAPRRRREEGGYAATPTAQTSADLL